MLGPALNVTGANVGNASALLQNTKQAAGQAFPQSPLLPSRLLGIGVALAIAEQSSIALENDALGDAQRSDIEAVVVSAGV